MIFPTLEKRVSKCDISGRNLIAIVSIDYIIDVLQAIVVFIAEQYVRVGGIESCEKLQR